VSNLAIKFENISKQYRLGSIGTGTLSHDLNRWWTMNVLRKEDPFLKIGSVNDRSTKDDSGFAWALKNIDLEIKQGEILGIIGKNGAGKSTLLKILSRVTTPSTGKITSYGRMASLLEVGTGFHLEMTGRENIFMNGAIMGMTKVEIRRKMDEIVDFAGIERYVDTPVKRYSSGMIVRLGFAIAAHMEPEILIVDEVLAVGDAEFQKKAIGKMHDVSQEGGRTVLFVSHNMSAVEQLCNRGIILSNGEISFNGTATDAIKKYITIESSKNNVLNNGWIDLNSRREKKYQANVFKQLKICDKNNLASDTFFMMSSMKIEVILENDEHYTDADYAIAILNPANQWVTSFASWMYPKETVGVPNKIVLEIPEIKFSPGKYFIYLSMTQHIAGIYIDRIENAASIIVEPSNVFKTGKEFTLSEGLMFPEGKLSLLS